MRELSQAERLAYREDGVALVPSAVDSQWVERLLALVDVQRAQP